MIVFKIINHWLNIHAKLRGSHCPVNLFAKLIFDHRIFYSICIVIHIWMCFFDSFEEKIEVFFELVRRNKFKMGWLIRLLT